MYGNSDPNPNIVTRVALDHLRDAVKVVVVVGACDEFSGFIGSFVREPPALSQPAEAA